MSRVNPNPSPAPALSLALTALNVTQQQSEYFREAVEDTLRFLPDDNVQAIYLQSWFKNGQYPEADPVFILLGKHLVVVRDRQKFGFGKQHWAVYDRSEISNVNVELEFWDKDKKPTDDTRMRVSFSLRGEEQALKAGGPNCVALSAFLKALLSVS